MTETRSSTEAAPADGTRPKSLAQRYARASVILILVGIVSIVIAACSAQVSPMVLLSYFPNDGHCNPDIQGLGVHCFGDFSLVREAFASGVPWTHSSGPSAIYPPIAWLPALLASSIGDNLLGGGRAGLILYLAFSSVSLLLPALWSARNRWRDDGALSLLILGFGAAPVLVAIDRGNSVAFVIPWIMMAAIGFLRDRPQLLFWGILIATLLKPQFLVLLLLPLCARRFRLALAVGISAVLVTLGSFLVFGANAVTYAQNWVGALSAYNRYQSVGSAFPYNLNPARALLTMTQLVVYPFLSGEQQSAVVAGFDAVAGYVSLIAAGLVAAVVLVCHNRVPRFYLLAAVLMLPMFTSSVIFHYYASILLVLGALILRSPWSSPDRGLRRGTLDDDRLTVRFLNHATLWTVALVLAPIAIPTTYPPFLAGDTAAAAGQVGLWPILLGPIILCYTVALSVGVVRTAVRSNRSTGPTLPGDETP